MENLVEISITDEFEDESKNQTFKAMLNVETGYILDVKRLPNQIEKPAKETDYEFSSGLLEHSGKEVEFAVNLEKGQYSVSRLELQEVKSKMESLLKRKVKP